MLALDGTFWRRRVDDGEPSLRCEGSITILRENVLMFDIQDYAYDLPEGLIAQVPSSRRDHARLLVVDRSEGTFLDRHFYDLPSLLNPGDLLVVNNTEVVPARLFGRKESGGQIEVLVWNMRIPTRKNPTPVGVSRNPPKGRRKGIVCTLGMMFQGPWKMSGMTVSPGSVFICPLL